MRPSLLLRTSIFVHCPVEVAHDPLNILKGSGVRDDHDGLPDRLPGIWRALEPLQARDIMAALHDFGVEPCQKSELTRGNEHLYERNTLYKLAASCWKLSANWLPGRWQPVCWRASFWLPGSWQPDSLPPASHIDVTFLSKLPFHLTLAVKPDMKLMRMRPFRPGWQI